MATIVFRSIQRGSSKFVRKITSMKITRVYADSNGESKFGEFEVESKISLKSHFTITQALLSSFSFKKINSVRPSGEIGDLSSLIPGSGLLFRKTSNTYNYDWHTAPRRQFIVNLDNEVELEVSSGEKRIIPAGKVFFVEDTTGKGHRARTTTGTERHSLFIPVDDSFLTST